MSTETAMPPAQEATASAPEQEAQTVQAEGQQTEQGNEPEKKEKQPWEREIRRKDRRIDTLTARYARLQAEHEQLMSQVTLTQQQRANSNQSPQDEDHPVSLTRKELDELIERASEKKAATLSQKRSIEEQRRSVVQGLAKEWGREKFEAYTSDLDAAFDGVTDDKGVWKPASEAVLESEMPGALIEYLADPDNAEEAEKLSRMTAIQAGRYVAKLETKLSAKRDEAKPQRSNAPAPVEPVRSGGKVNQSPDPKDTKSWMRWRNEQEAKGLL